MLKITFKFSVSIQLKIANDNPYYSTCQLNTKKFTTYLKEYSFKFEDLNEIFEGILFPNQFLSIDLVVRIIIGFLSGLTRTYRFI